MPGRVYLRGGGSPSIRTAAIVGLGVLLALGPAEAHHTFVQKYDSARLVTLSGVVASVSYTNPHISFDLDAGGASWAVETESIPVARARGLTEARLQAGARVTVTGWPARDKTAAMGLSTIAFKGGPTIKMRGTAR